MRFLSISAPLILAAASMPAPAFAADWRTCAVAGCIMGPCASDEALVITSHAMDVDNPAIGGVDAAAEGLKKFFLRRTNGQVSGQLMTRCSDAHPSSEAAQVTARRVYEEMEAAFPRGFVTMAYTNMMFPGYDAAMARSDAGSGDQASAEAPSESAAPAKPAEPAKPAQAPTGKNYVDPMNFIMWVDLREPINGTNSLCFHAIKTRPAPEGYRDSWPSLKNALPIIQSYFPLMLKECSKHGTPVSTNVQFATDDVSPADKRRSMQADVERWRKMGFPEVYISN